MVRLENRRREVSESVCTTLANPIKVMNYLELREVILGIILIFYFGIVFTSPVLLTFLLFFLWGVWPQIRSKFERGIVMQKLYRWFGVCVQGTVRPPSCGKFRI